MTAHSGDFTSIYTTPATLKGTNVEPTYGFYGDVSDPV